MLIPVSVLPPPRRLVQWNCFIIFIPLFVADFFGIFVASYVGYKGLSHAIMAGQQKRVPPQARVELGSCCACAVCVPPCLVFGSYLMLRALPVCDTRLSTPLYCPQHRFPFWCLESLFPAPPSRTSSLFPLLGGDDSCGCSCFGVFSLSYGLVGIPLIVVQILICVRLATEVYMSAEHHRHTAKGEGRPLCSVKLSSSRASDKLKQQYRNHSCKADIAHVRLFVAVPRGSSRAKARAQESENRTAEWAIREA